MNMLLRESGNTIQIVNYGIIGVNTVLGHLKEAPFLALGVGQSRELPH